MKLTIEIPANSVIVTVNALYEVGDDLRMTSACVTDPTEGQKLTLDGMEEVKQ